MMLIFYKVGIRLMIFAIKILSVYKKKEKRLLEGQKEVFERLAKLVDPQGGYVWIHASSLGEFEQGRPVIERIKREDPSQKILLTFFSPSGYEVRKDYPGVDVVSYLPFDKSRYVRQFLDMVKPSSAVFIKYEFWANYLLELHRRRIPTYLISAIFRENQIFFKPQGGLFRRMLKCYTRLFVQDQDSADRLATIGINKVTICGDTRVDRVIEIMQANKALPLIDAFVSNKGDRDVLIVGSSWPKDENLIIPYFNTHPELMLIIAPHEIDPYHIQSIKAKLKRPLVCYSEATTESVKGADCLLVDGFGLLSSIYKFADIAYIGGGFGAGIHNTLEAAVYGIPVLFGPNNKKFREARGLLVSGGGIEIKTEQDFVIAMEEADWRKCGKAAGDYVWHSKGAAQLVTDTILGRN